VSELVIIGAGEHGRVLADIARASGVVPLGFVQPGARPPEAATDQQVDGLPILGWLADPQLRHALPAGSVDFSVALGANDARRAAYDQALTIGWKPRALIHPSAVMLGGAVIEPGAQVCAGAVIGLAATIAPNAIVNTAATVDHDGRIEAHTFIGPGAHLAGRVTVEQGAHVGLGALVREGCRIGAGAYVAAGAVVIRDVPPGMRVAGVPARLMDPESPAEVDP
jgi:sugar O-acyltransferase (sialic acid O-acetyltransferase NeuD family)